MNIVMVRLIVILFLGIGNYVCIKKKIYKSSKKAKIIFAIVAFIIACIPFDNLIFKFSTIEKYIKYYYPTDKIVNIIEGENYSIVECQNKSDKTNLEMYIMFCKEKTNNWTCNLPKYSDYIVKDNEVLVIYYFENSNSLYIEMTNLLNTFTITDNQKTVFNNYTGRVKKKNIEWQVSTALIKNYNSDYYILINGKKTDINIKK